MAGLRIQTNVPALAAGRALDETVRRLNRSIERLASGLRVNRAADDAAGLALSERIRTRVRGLEQARQNVLDGLSALQTADGGLVEVAGMLQRIRSLAVQAASDVLTDADRNLIQTEVSELRTEIDRMTSTVVFNGIQLLRGPGVFSFSEFRFLAEGRFPNITPDETRVVYAQEGAAHLRRINVDGTGQVVLFDEAGQQNSPFVAANGRVYFDSGNDFTGDKSIKSVRVSDGGDLQTHIASGGADDGYFAPHVNLATGKIVANNFDAADGGRVVTANLDGSGLTTVFDSVPPETQLSLSRFSPDGTRIGFSEATAGLRIMNADGSNVQTVLTQSPQFWDFTPDGQSILYVTQDGQQIRQRALDGSSDVEIAVSGVTPFFAFFDISEGGRLATIARVSGPTQFDIYIADASQAGGSPPFQIQVGPEKGDTITLAIPRHVTAGSLGVASVSVATRASASTAISQIDAALDELAELRTEIGAQMNRLESASTFTGVSLENQAAADSRIRELDFAEEIVALTRDQILQQTGVSALAQANLTPSAVLALLG